MLKQEEQLLDGWKGWGGGGRGPDLLRLCLSPPPHSGVQYKLSLPRFTCQIVSIPEDKTISNKESGDKTIYINLVHTKTSISAK